ncbi:hypothetical protein AOLI_G00033650 [Acnodon oligacanthus]
MIVEGGDSMISSPAATRGNAGIVSRNNEMVGLRRVLVEVSLVEKGRERKRGKASLGTVKSCLEISVHQEKDRRAESFFLHQPSSLVGVGCHVGAEAVLEAQSLWVSLIIRELEERMAGPVSGAGGTRLCTSSH